MTSIVQLRDIASGGAFLITTLFSGWCGAADVHAPGRAASSGSTGNKPVPAASAKAESSLPPFPYQYVGTVAGEGMSTLVSLTNGSQDFMVSVGDVLEEKYRVDGIGADSIDVTYLPMGRKQSIYYSSIPRSAQPEVSLDAGGAIDPATQAMVAPALPVSREVANNPSVLPGARDAGSAPQGAGAPRVAPTMGGFGMPSPAATVGEPPRAAIPAPMQTSPSSSGAGGIASQPPATTPFPNSPATVSALPVLPPTTTALPVFQPTTTTLPISPPTTATLPISAPSIGELPITKPGIR